MVPFSCCPIQRRSFVLSDLSSAVSDDDITEPVKDTPLGKNANVPPLGPTSFGTSPALKKPSVILPYSIATFAVYNPINWN